MPVAGQHSFPDGPRRRRRGQGGQRGSYGLGAQPSLRDGDGGPGSAGVERRPGGREPHHESPVERAADTVGRGEPQPAPAQAPQQLVPLHRERRIPGPFPPPLPLEQAVSPSGVDPSEA